MNNNQKKTAVRAGTPTAASRKTFSINSILKNGGNVNVLIKEPGEIPRAIKAIDIPPKLIGKKLQRTNASTGLTIIYDPKSTQRANVAIKSSRFIFRGTLLVASVGLYGLRKMSQRDIDRCFVWLMNNAV